MADRSSQGQPPHKVRVLFSRENVGEVLEVFGMGVDGEDYVIKADGSRAKSIDGEYVKKDELIGIFPGSEILVRSDPRSITEYFDKRLG